MIYLDSSILLAQILMEDRQPPATLWRQELASSRLLQYEVWTRVNARRLGDAGRVAAETALAEVDLYDLTPDVLERALYPFPVTLRTLDALHLATADYLRCQGVPVAIASYDHRLLGAARALGMEIAAL